MEDKSYYIRIAERSFLSKVGLRVAAGVVDPGFTGIIKIVLQNLGKEQISIFKGQRIAQILFEKLKQVEVGTLDKYPDNYKTQRGDSGFGSTGK